MSETTALGIDVGSATAKIVGVDHTGELHWHRIEPTEPRIEEQASRLLDQARASAGGTADLPVVATGYGRNLTSGAAKKVTEISCHARGVFACMRQTGTLIDIGGQDTKVIAIGENGKVVNFAMNDKCAAGTGRFLEVSAAKLMIPIGELGQTALDADGEVSISSTCTVFAESEIISLIARGEPVEHIVRGLHRSLIGRVIALARSIQPRAPFMISGGLARSPAVRALLSEAFGEPVQVPKDPQLMGAYGAALFALDRAG